MRSNKVFIFSMLVATTVLSSDDTLSSSEVDVIEQLKQMKAENNKSVDSYEDEKESETIPAIRSGYTEEVVSAHSQKLSETKKIVNNDAGNVLRIVAMYLKKEYSAAKYLIEDSEIQMEQGDRRAFIALISLSEKITQRIPAEAEIATLINMEKADYFFIVEAAKKLRDDGRLLDAISLLKNTSGNKNDFVKRQDFSRSALNKVEVEHYLTVVDEKVEKNVLLASVYEQNGNLLEAYELLEENNASHKYGGKILELRKQIKFRVELYQQQQPENTLNSFQTEMLRSQPFIVFSATKID